MVHVLCLVRSLNQPFFCCVYMQTWNNGRQPSRRSLSVGSCVYSGLFRGTCLTRPRRFSSRSTPRNLQFNFSFFLSFALHHALLSHASSCQDYFTLFKPRFSAASSLGWTRQCLTVSGFTQFRSTWTERPLGLARLESCSTACGT